MEWIAEVPFWLGVVLGGLLASLPLAKFVVGKTATKKDDKVVAWIEDNLIPRIDDLEKALNKDLDGDGDIAGEKK